jgi:hypothetical protein
MGKCRQLCILYWDQGLTWGLDLLGRGQPRLGCIPDQHHPWDLDRRQQQGLDQHQQQGLAQQRHWSTTTNASRHSHLGCRLDQRRPDQLHLDQRRLDQQRLDQQNLGYTLDQGRLGQGRLGQDLVGQVDQEDQVDLGRRQQCTEGTPVLAWVPAVVVGGLALELGKVEQPALELVLEPALELVRKPALDMVQDMVLEPALELVLLPA